MIRVRAQTQRDRRICEAVSTLVIDTQLSACGDGAWQSLLRRLGASVSRWSDCSR